MKGLLKLHEGKEAVFVKSVPASLGFLYSYKIGTHLRAWY